MSRARDLANLGDGIDATQITSGQFDDNRIKATNVTQHEGSIDALASNPTVTLGSNATVSADVDLDTVLPFSSSAFSNNTPVYFEVGQIRIALGFTTTASSASVSGYNNYATADEIQVTGYGHAPRVFIEVQTNYEETSFSGLITDITLHSGNTYKFKPWMSTSNRNEAIQSREMHFMVIGAKA